MISTRTIGSISRLYLTDSIYDQIDNPVYTAPQLGTFFLSGAGFSIFCTKHFNVHYYQNLC